MNNQQQAPLMTKVYGRQDLKVAAKALREGQLVAFPTETVFGLGAIANNEEAVNNVYQTKGRPSDNPLIVHVHKISAVAQYVTEVSPVAEKLMKAFWPGPLTILFPIEEGVFAPNVAPGRQTVGMRMPNQLETLLLIEMVGFPLVGPSANLSGKPSPTTVQHVLNDFEGQISGVVDNHGDLTAVGVESTVVLPQDDQIIILRPGAITQSMLQQATGLRVIERSSEDQLKDPTVASPGVKYRHYSPNQAVYGLGSNPQQWEEQLKLQPLKVGVLAQTPLVQYLQAKGLGDSYFSLGEVTKPEQATQRLFAGLRALEAQQVDVIYAQLLEDDEATHAYMNRLNKALTARL